nr:uncharacterized protein LOC128686966 isoform X1 [Cherax quadricarinatus]
MQQIGKFGSLVYRPSELEWFDSLSMTTPQDVHDVSASVCESDLALSDDIVNVITMDPMADTGYTDLGDPDTAYTDLGDPDTAYIDLGDPDTVCTYFGDTTFVPQMDASEATIPSTVESMPGTAADDLNLEQMVAVAPSDIFEEEVPKKRERKRKSQDEARPSRRRRPKKPKLNETETPFENEELGEKAKNTQTTKINRNLGKQRLLDMQMELSAATAERDNLQEVQQLQRSRQC